MQSIKHIKTCLKNNANTTWNIIKELMGKTNKSGSRLPSKFVINKNGVTCEIGIATDFNKFFKNIGPDLARKIPTALITL